MKFKNIVLLFLFIAVGFVHNLSATANAETIIYGITEPVIDDIVTHTVRKGETVYSIAAAYHTTVEEIYKLNPKAEKGIKDGDKLKIQKVTRKITGYSEHLIEAKETLYSVSRMYKISEDDVKDANPGLSETTFRMGRKIKIPVYSYSNNAAVPLSNNSFTLSSEPSYQVQKGETLYSIGKAFDVSTEALVSANPTLRDGGLKEGMTLKIPSKLSQEVKVGVNGQNVVSIAEVPYAPKGETVRIGVLFPFLDKKGSIPTEKITEYYEGFLLAVKNLKEKGFNAEIYTFDIGQEKNTKKLESLLGTNEMKNLHLIIGGVSKQQIDVLSKFSKKTGIKYVLPFGSTNEVESCPTIFQMTTTHSSLYDETIRAFIRQYRDHNIIFVSEAGSNKDKSDFVNALKKDLTSSNIQFKNTASSSSLIDDINSVMDATKKNVLVPTSSTEVTLKRIITAINTIPTAADNITLFGYPEWQIYTQHSIGLHKYNACIYSIFFVDDRQKEVQDFLSEYKKWYNKDLINSFPKYGYLGYDAGLYFLTALNKNGSDFTPKVDNIRVNTLQSAIHLEQVNNNGGFINHGLYFIHYKAGSDIEKIDVSNR